jgi:hypothetical protein
MLMGAKPKDAIKSAAISYAGAGLMGGAKAAVTPGMTVAEGVKGAYTAGMKGATVAATGANTAGDSVISAADVSVGGPNSVPDTYFDDPTAMGGGTPAPAGGPTQAQMLAEQYAGMGLTPGQAQNMGAMTTQQGVSSAHRLLPTTTGALPTGTTGSSWGQNIKNFFDPRTGLRGESVYNIENAHNSPLYQQIAAGRNLSAADQLALRQAVVSQNPGALQRWAPLAIGAMGVASLLDKEEPVEDQANQWYDEDRARVDDMLRRDPNAFSIYTNTGPRPYQPPAYMSRGGVVGLLRPNR